MIYLCCVRNFIKTHRLDSEDEGEGQGEGERALEGDLFPRIIQLTAMCCSHLDLISTPPIPL